MWKPDPHAARAYLTNLILDGLAQDFAKEIAEEGLTEREIDSIITDLKREAMVYAKSEVAQ